MSTITPAAADTIRSLNPATGAIVGEVPVTPAAEVPGIIAAARAAQAAWAELGINARIDRLRPAAEALQRQADAIGRLITEEMGKPLGESTGEVQYCAGSLPAELNEIREALAPTIVERDGIRSTVYRDPLGVAAAITPWNFPVQMPHQQIIPALAAGNTVVFKPSEETPLTGQAYADVLASVLPPDVLRIIHGADAQGRALVEGDVNLITFTGSREVGKRIFAEASSGLKRVILELGGKDPLIVLDDADLAAAAAFAARNSFRNAGQVCVSTERIYVSRAVRNDFVRALTEAAAAFTPTCGLEDDATMGPMASRRQRDHVLGQIDHAIREGATLALGGDRGDGNFIGPTILTDVTQDMAIARDETFGPVACVITVGDDDEAVRLANDTPYGLGAVVFGEHDHASRIARRLSAGMIGVNRSIGGAGGTPWVGARESGYGFHSSPDGHRQFCQTRVVSEPAAGGGSGGGG